MPLRTAFRPEGDCSQTRAETVATSNLITWANKKMKNGEKQKTSASEHQSRAEALLDVRKSGVHGTGVYAKQPVKKGRRIIEYTGRIVPWKKATEQEDGPHTFLFGLTNGRDVIDPDVGGNEARWINHSCEPNCEAIEEGNRVFIYALKPLQAGDELFYDYGLEVDQPRTPQLEEEYRCFCGAVRCRGTLLGKKKSNRASARAAKRKPKGRRQKRKAQS
jgi:SET domain-containing protein